MTLMQEPSDSTGIHSISALAALLLMIPAIALGYGFHDATSSGNELGSVSVRSASIVCCKVFGADGPDALFINPAALDRLGGLRLHANGSAIAWEEEVIDSTSVTDRASTGPGGLTFAVGTRFSDRICAACGISRVSDFQYSGTHFLPNDPSEPNVDIVEILEADGGLWEALGGGSLDLGAVVLGASAGLRFGGVDYIYTYDTYYTPYVDSTYQWSWSESEPCFHAGVTVGDEGMSAGATWTSGGDHYEQTVAFSGRARAEHLANTIIVMEGEVIEPGDDNTFRGKLGLETPIRRVVNLMIGVGFWDGPEMAKTGMTFSVGGNFTMGQLRIDTAVLHNGRSRLSTSFPSEFSDRVDDNWTTFALGLTYDI